MRRTVITITAVAILIASNSLGLILLGINQDLSDSSDLYEEDQNPDIHGNLNDAISDSSIKDLQNPQNNEDIDWDFLPQDKNPSAKIFSDEKVIAIEYLLSDLTFLKTEDGELIHADDLTPMLEPGSPMVPEIRFFVGVPEGSYIANIELIESEPRQINGHHAIAPYLPRTMDGESVGVEPNMEIYESSEPFPSNLYEITGPDKLRHLDALEVVLFPVSYIPIEGEIQVYDLIRLQIDLELGDTNYPTIVEDDDLDIAILDMLANPNDVIITSQIKSPHGTRAPSMIKHTLGFHSDAGTIHSVKDTTTGNSDLT
jgi:hypothetical protein